MIQIAVCDDQAEERMLLKTFLERYFSRTGHFCEVTEYSTGEALCDDYAEGTADYDLIFLDIFMGEMDGIQTARAIRQQNDWVPVVFLTTTPDYALEGYDVCAIGYLLKPLVPEKAAALLERFLRLEYRRGQKALLLREGARGSRIFYRDILYVESRNTVVLVHTVDGQEHRIYRKLDEVEQELAGQGFLRCHQSFLVNLAHVCVAGKDFFLLEGDVRIPLRRREAKRLRDACFQYLVEQAELTKL